MSETIVPVLSPFALHRAGSRYYGCRLTGRQRRYAPVLLLGGAFQDMRALRRFAAQFLASTDVLLVDLPGSGCADPLDPDVGTGFLADCIPPLLAHAGVDSVNVVGVSFGTAVAHAFAQRHPSMVSKLVLIGTMSEVDASMVGALRACAAAANLGDGEEFIERVCVALLNRRCGDVIEQHSLTEKLLRRSLERAPAADRDRFVENAERMIRHRRLRQEHPIRCPTLVFTGEHDHLTTPARSRQVAAGIGGALFTTVRRADHLLPLERPEICVNLVDSFLRGRLVRAPRDCTPIQVPSAAPRPAA